MCPLPGVRILSVCTFLCLFFFNFSDTSFFSSLGGSGMKTAAAQFSFVVARSFTADGNLLQPTEHPHTSHSLVFLSTHNSVACDIGSRCQCASNHPWVIRLCV